jgi:hypothetical protein
VNSVPQEGPEPVVSTVAEPRPSRQETRARPREDDNSSRSLAPQEANRLPGPCLHLAVLPAAPTAASRGA